MNGKKKTLSLILALVLVLGVVFPATVSADSGEKEVTIFSLNDFHGAVQYQEGRTPGMARIVGYYNKVKKDSDNTIFVSGGDAYQGTAISNLLYGEPVSKMFKALGVEASSVGNHEFDWGVEHFTKWSEEGGFPFLATNIVEEATGQPVSWAKPYKIVERDGVKIAFIGLAHEDTTTLTKRENIEGLKFESAVEAAQKWVEYLEAGKADEGKPDAIIALTHIDSRQDKDGNITGNILELAEVKGLDGIISAHSHQRVAGKVNGIPVVQGGSNGYNFAKLNLKFDKNNKLISGEAELDDLRGKTADLPEDPETLKELNKYLKEVEPVLNEKLGVAEGEFTHNSKVDNVTLLGRWSSEVMREFAETQITIQNGGGLRRTLDAGEITMGDMYEIMPFDNSLVTFDLSGKDLKAAIDLGINNPKVGNGQFVGVVVEYNPKLPFQQRVISMTLEDGTPIKDDEYYSVVTNDFMFTGGDGYDFSRAKNVVETYVPIREALVDAIKKDKTIKPVEVDYLIETDKMPEGEIVPVLNKIDNLAYINGYEDKTVRPEKEISREEASTVLFKLLDKDYADLMNSKENNFKDVKDTKWSNEAISTLAKAKLLNGFADGTFKPEDNLTRAELMKIVSVFSTKTEVKKAEFTDIKEASWAEEYINIGVAEGWIKGYEDGTFKPNNEITRAEFVSIMNKVLGRKVEDYSEQTDVIEFKDLEKGKWYYNDMIEASNVEKAS